MQVIPNRQPGLGRSVLLTVDDHGCEDRICNPGPVPWRAAVLMGPAPVGPNVLPVGLEVQTCGTPRDSFHVTRVPFVVDSCPGAPPIGCLIPAWEPPSEGECNAYLTPTEPAQLSLHIATPIPLSGLQGDLNLQTWPSVGSLRIIRIEPIGPALGMHLSWVPTDQGARFVLFAEHGAPILPSPTPVPVLAVTVAVQRGQTPPERSFIGANNLLGSDIGGNAVIQCNNVRLLPGVICSGHDCDDNGDGRVDVRDLVLMVHCLPPAECGPRALFDCNRDSTFNIDDVICCARRILGRPDCPDCPPDTTPPRKELSIQLGFGAPRMEGGSTTIPIQLTGIGRLGAARFALKYPADRYDIAAVQFPGAPSDWLTLYEIQGDQVVVGLIGLSPRLLHDVPLDVTVRLTLEPGQTAGGQVSWASSEFSGTDGASLEITMAHAPLPLAGPASVALSAGRPNPFSSSTSFTLTLSQAAAVEIGVFDVGGRSVASIQKGSLAAGSHSFEWNGRTAGGAAAGSGIYFIRATAGAESATRRMVLLRAQ